MEADQKRIMFAWLAEGARRRAAGSRPPADQLLQLLLVPPGGEWECVVADGATTRSIVWRGKEVALVNARGDLDDATESDIAMGLCATPVMDTALRVISILADSPDNLELIGRIAVAAIDYVERPAPEIHEPEDDREAGED